MAELPGETTAPPPPPPPQETLPPAPAAIAKPSLEADTPSSASQDTETAGSGAATATLDSAQPKAESAHRPPPQETIDAAAVGKPEQTTTEADGQPPVATMPQKVAALSPPAETPAQESAAPTAPTPPPPPPPPPEKQEGGDPKPASSVHEEEKDASKARKEEGQEKPARRRWRSLRAAVCLLFLRPKSGETKPPTPPGDKKPASRLEEEEKQTPGEKGMPPPQKDSSAVRVPSKPEAGKGEGETKPAALDGKRPEPGQEQVATLPPPAGKPAVEKGEDEMKPPEQDGKKRPLKRFQMAGRLVQFVTSLYNKVNRSQSQEHHRNWPREEMRLEHILEEAFTKLLAAEYNKELRGVKQKCLLTFSVFELASEVKKQAMIYWWVAEFNLPHRSDPPAPAARAPPPPPPPPAGGGGKSDSPPPAQGKGADAADSRDDNAEGIFFMLSDHGFLVPIKNWCTKVIHGCQVNPLVHWMLKRQARGARFAELDEKGSPAVLQLNSSILCLTSGNRPVLQKIRMEDEAQPQAQGKKKDESRPQSQDGRKSKKKVTNEPSLEGKSNDVQDQQQPTTKDEAQEVGSESMAGADKATSRKEEEDATQPKDQLTKGAQNIKPITEPEHADEMIPISVLQKFVEGKRVMLNVNAHVYPISRSAFLPLAECLVVLQLGRWNNADDKTYMEVDGLESRNVIGLLKNLRYLSLRGLSRLGELPKGIESLKKLEILDMRGCQNLAKVVVNEIWVINPVREKKLKQLTHLDLTECYMLEHIGQGITSLTELQVFKGFVFATGTHGKKACRIQDLKKLKKLQKLTISITTDANVGKNEMAELKSLTSLQKLTITWSEIPSILEGETDTEKNKKKNALVEIWTSFKLPKDLVKLDIRCYPKKVLELQRHTKLEKLYLRGGDMERFSTEKSTSIKTLRLRYLKKFTMKWKDIHSELQNVEYVEIVVTNKDATRGKDKSGVIKATEDEEEKPMKKVMNIPDFKLDGHGVWTKDQKEEDYEMFHATNNKASGPSEATQDSGTETTSANTNEDAGDKTTTNQVEQPAIEERVATQEGS